MISIAELPTVCLDRIFDHLPLSDLLFTVPNVCVQWAELHPFACHRRALSLRPLILANSGLNSRIRTLEPELNDTNTYCNSKNLVTNIDGRRYLDSNEVELFGMQKLDWNRLNEEHCDLLASLLRGLTELVWQYTSMDASFHTSQMDAFTRLIHGPWSASLRSLTIHFDCQDLSLYYMGHETESWFYLIKAINSLIHLRCLTLKIMSNLDRHGISCPQLSIVGQLEQFTFDGKGLMQCNDDEEWIDTWIVSVRDYASSNGSLQTIAIGPDSKVGFAHPNQPNYVLNLDPHVCARFTELHIDDGLFSDQLPIAKHQTRNMSKFAVFCRRFSSLTCLSIKVGACTLTELMDALGHLRQLVRLNLTVNGTRAGEVMPVDDWNSSLPPPMPSVRVLFFRIDALERHTDLERFHLEHLFPCLQVVDFWNKRQECTVCRFDRQNLSDPVLRRISACERISRATFKHCAQLERLYYRSTISTALLAALSENDFDEADKWIMMNGFRHMDRIRAILMFAKSEEIVELKKMQSKTYFTLDEL